MRSDKLKASGGRAIVPILTVGLGAILLICLIATALVAMLSESTGALIVTIVIAFAGGTLVVNRIINSIVGTLLDFGQRLLDITDKGDLRSPVKKDNYGTEITTLSMVLEETIFAIERHLEELGNGLKSVADGDLSYTLKGEWKGDFDAVKKRYDDILNDLRSLFSDIASASGQVNTGSHQVAISAQNLSDGASQQAISVKELSGQVDDISQKVNTNAQSAKNTETIVQKTARQIDICSKEMSNMLEAIEDINHSSEEISKIIKVINDIAFQTNILALNAAVEAAHAGEAGKGFAVVADEVRNLAAKSAEAASQTTSLIENSVASVEKGSKIAKETALVLDEIVEGSKQISAEIEKISEASAIQAEAVVKITGGVENISAVVQDNNATAQRSAAASEELSGQSAMLKQMIGHFKFANDDKKSSESTYKPVPITSAPPAQQPKPKPQTAPAAKPQAAAPTAKPQTPPAPSKPAAAAASKAAAPKAPAAKPAVFTPKKAAAPAAKPAVPAKKPTIQETAMMEQKPVIFEKASDFKPIDFSGGAPKPKKKIVLDDDDDFINVKGKY